MVMFDHTHLSEVKRLVTTERIETVIPITYMVLMALAYYGPNAENILGIKLTLWHHNAIADIFALLETLGTLLVLDFASFIINGALLKYYCNVNVVKVLKRVQRDFWFWFAVAEATIFLEVRITPLL